MTTAHAGVTKVASASVGGASEHNERPPMDIPLDTTPSYPHSRVFVLRLHRDADPARGDVVGRVEHVDSGRCERFESLAELARQLARHGAEPPG